MALLLYFILPFVVVNLVEFAVSRRRVSLPRMLFQGYSGIIASVLSSLFLLLPQERMELSSAEGMLRLNIGKSSVLFCLLLYIGLGVVFALCLSEESVDRVPRKKRRMLLAALAALFFFVLLFLSQAYLWGRTVYGNTTLDMMLFYLNMPLEGTSFNFALSVFHSVFLPAALFFLPVLLLLAFPAKKARQITLLRRIRFPLFPLRVPLSLSYLFLLAWLIVLIVHSNSMLKFDEFILSHLSASEFIEQNYVDPGKASIVFPEKKRNLITVYLESYETTPQDIASGGVLDVNLMPEMTQIAKEHVSFSRNEKITGAVVPPRCSWTMAGLIAQTAGLPLMYFSNNDGSNAQTLLPSAVTLGDILREEGYNLMFMAGSDFTFGGRRAYYREHGDYQVWDLFTAREEKRIPEDYYTGWGFEDKKLYDYSKEQILNLAAKEEPFHFAMLSVDTHTPGFRCDLCPTDYQNVGADAFNYADILRCSSAQFAQFLSWCQQQPFYENTTIVVTGDHQTMQDYFYRNMLGSIEASDAVEHYVYNAFINTPCVPAQMKDRLFTTLDFFPTTLASIGAVIEGDRLGLGTNLFSKRETLTEQYSEELVFEELKKKSHFYDQHLLYMAE